MPRRYMRRNPRSPKDEGANADALDRDAANAPAVVKAIAVLENADLADNFDWDKDLKNLLRSL